jgi:hypothetical protein
MPEDLKIETPGDTPVPDALETAAPALNNADDSSELAALKTENAQLRATVELLNQQLADASVDRAESAQPAEPAPPRLIGEDWSSMTAAEAQAAGCKSRVLCRDGYFIPA